MELDEFINFMLGVNVDEPSPFAIVYDGNLTAIVWEDGSVTRTHRKDPDKYDPLFGTLACIVRKISNNRGHSVDDNEALIAELASSIHSVDDIDGLIKYAKFTLNILNVLRGSQELWLPHLGPSDDDEPAKEAEETYVDRLMKDYEDIFEKRGDEARAEVRRMLDLGEL